MTNVEFDDWQIDLNPCSEPSFDDDSTSGSVFISFAPVADDVSPRILNACRNVLSDVERDVADRFHFDRDRACYLMAHALLRAALSRHDRVTPAEWSFRSTENGKPELAVPHDASGIRFNLSHTRGMVACAIARDREIGIDVENSSREVEYSSLASTCFAASEAEFLSRQPNECQPGVFYDLWTLKEAWIKAIGLGLRAPLKEFAFDISDTARPVISFANPGDHDPACWWFYRRQFPSHRLAVACSRDSGAEVRFVIRRAVFDGVDR